MVLVRPELAGVEEVRLGPGRAVDGHSGARPPHEREVGRRVRELRTASPARRRSAPPARCPSPAGDDHARRLDSAAEVRARGAPTRRPALTSGNTAAAGARGRRPGRRTGGGVVEVRRGTRRGRSVSRASRRSSGSGLHEARAERGRPARRARPAGPASSPPSPAGRRFPRGRAFRVAVPTATNSCCALPRARPPRRASPGT